MRALPVQEKSTMAPSHPSSHLAGFFSNLKKNNPQGIESHFVHHSKNVASLCVSSLAEGSYDGGDIANPFILPFGPSMLGMGFLVALTVLIRGTPCRTRGSFIKVGSSFAGASAGQHSILPT